MAFWYPDTSRQMRRKLLQLGVCGSLLQFAATAMVGAILLLGLGPVLFAGGTAAPLLVGLGIYGLGVGLAGYGLQRTYPHDSLGFCNAVTLLRLVLVATLFVALVHGAAAPWYVFWLAAIALALDGLDGWLARREKLVSDFGARFDMEVDSALALVLALLAYGIGAAGVVVLLLGLPRYLFALAGLALPWLHAPLPERFSRKAVCVLQLSTLIVLQLPLLPSGAAGLLVGCAATALIWSFARDILTLWRERP